MRESILDTVPIFEYFCLSYERVRHMCVLCVTVSGERAGRVDRSTHVGVVRLFDELATGDRGILDVLYFGCVLTRCP